MKRIHIVAAANSLSLLMLVYPIAPVMAAEKSSYRISGIVGTDKTNYVALLELSDGTNLLIRKGDALENAIVKKITGKCLYLESPQGDKERCLSSGERPEPLNTSVVAQKKTDIPVTVDPPPTQYPPGTKIVGTKEIDELDFALKRLTDDSRDNFTDILRMCLNLDNLHEGGTIISINGITINSAKQGIQDLVQSLNKNNMPVSLSTVNSDGIHGTPIYLKKSGD